MRFLLLMAAVLPPVVIVAYVHGRDGNTAAPRLVWEGFLLGTCAGIVALGTVHLLSRVGVDSGNALVKALTDSFFRAGLLEEAAKLATVVIFAWNHADRRAPHDLLVVAAAVAGGFAALENIGFLLDRSDWPMIAATRALLSAPGHIFAAAVGGACLAYTELGGGRMLWWAMALILPAMLHGLYDFPLMLGSAALQGRSGDLGYAAVLPLILSAAVVLTGAVLTSTASRRVHKRQSDHQGIVETSIHHDPWLSRHQFRGRIWRIGGIVLLVIAIAFMTASLFRAEIALATIGLPCAFYAWACFSRGQLLLARWLTILPMDRGWNKRLFR